MKANKYLLILNICILLIFGLSNVIISSRTSANKEYFEKGYKFVKSKTGGELDYLKVMEYSPSKGEAKIFIVENLPTIEGGRKNFDVKYQAGRLVPFVRDDMTDTWKPDWENQKLYWKDLSKTGNKFTFPPFIGKDKMILFKQ